MTTLLKGHIDLSDIKLSGGDIVESLVDNLDIGGLIDNITSGDRKAVRNANYLFDKFGDAAATKLVEVFQREGEPLPEAEWQIAVDAAKATLNQHGMS
ncbi:MAG: hypothetical protein K0U66_04155, partial [Gammaproteobacteria bacterium]|nr:hypothetical protein [Gammaproteobacteria bacterium]